MAQWNKIIVSGSDAVLKTATLSNGIAVGTQVISASQAGTQLTGSFTGSFKGDGSGLTGVTAAGTISSSAQIVWSQVNYNTGIVSSSTQVAADLPANTVSSSTQVIAFLPTGTVSSSTQINTGSFTGSFVGAFTGSILSAGVVSSSAQVVSALPAGTVSSSAQVTADLPTGTVSSSAQIVWSSVPYNTGIVSSSAQVVADIAGQTIAPSSISASGNISGSSINVTGNSTIGGNLVVSGLLTAASQSIQYVSSSQLNVSTNRIIVNTDNSLRFGGLSVIDSGSAGNSGSLYWDSLNNRWVYENNSGQAPYHTAILVNGPVNTGALGSERGFNIGRVPVAVADDHIDTAPQSSSIRVDFVTGRTDIEQGLFVTGSLTANGTVTLAGIPSSSAQVTALLPGGTVSSSAQVTADLPAGTVSSSTQIVWASVPYNTGIVSSSTQVAADLPAGTVSSSTQFNSLTAPFTGSFTGSFTGDGSNLTGIATNLYISGSTSGNSSINLKTQPLIVSGANGITATVSSNTLTLAAPAGTVSSSGQVSYTGLSNIPAGIVSSSTQVAADLPAGTVSSSAQYPGWVTASSQIQLSQITGTTFATANFSFPQSVTIGGDLTVNGTTTTVNTANLNIEDRFILVNSGSALGGTAQGGTVVDSGNGSGSAMFYTTAGSVNRWGLADNVPYNATTATQTAYVAAAVDMTVAAQSSSLSNYAKVGNIRVDTNGDIYIYG